MNTEEIIEGYLGNIEVNNIYQGSELIWPIYFGDKYLIGGRFTTYNGSTQNRLVRLNNDDTKDTSFNIGIGFNGEVDVLDVDTINQKIYVGGHFTAFKGVTQNRIVRLNMNGSLDTSFNIGTGFDNSNGYSNIVNRIAIDTINQKIYVGGNFTTYNGSTQYGLIRLNMDGSKDTSFNIGVGFSNSVNTLYLDTINQKLYVGGQFTTYQGSTQNRLIRLNMDGTKDNTFNIGTGFNGSVNTLYLDIINQKLYAGGYFTTFQGNTQNKLIRLNLDGSKDTSFNIGTGFGVHSVDALNLDTINQKLYAGGNFDSFQGNKQRSLIRLNMNGTKDTSFNIGTGFHDISGYNGEIKDILIDYEKNKIYIGGRFDYYNWQPQKHIVRLNYDGSLDTSFNIQLDFAANTILKYTV